MQGPDSPAPHRRRPARRADALDSALAGDLVRLRDGLTFLRLRHGLTQKQVARVLGIEQSNVSRVEVGGAVKNVVAIAIGMCDGLEMGLNARAGLMTRGLREMTRLGVELGANPLTFQGLSGMGDLVLTCTGDLSRNRRVGIELGQGKTLQQIIAGMDQVAEGVKTTYAVCRLADRIGVEMPIAAATRRVLDGELKPKDAGLQLLTRQLRTELE